MRSCLDLASTDILSDRLADRRGVVLDPIGALVEFDPVLHPAAFHFVAGDALHVAAQLRPAGGRHLFGLHPPADLVVVAVLLEVLAGEL